LQLDDPDAHHSKAESFMKKREKELRQKVLQWLVYADEDLRLAECVRKVVRAALADAGINLPNQ